jgi:hypothetical protein
VANGQEKGHSRPIQKLRCEGRILMKKEYIRVRLNEIEKKVLIENSKKAKMTMSDYIRYCCIVIPYEKIKEVKL